MTSGITTKDVWLHEYAFSHLGTTFGLDLKVVNPQPLKPMGLWIDYCDIHLQISSLIQAWYATCISPKQLVDDLPSMGHSPISKHMNAFSKKL